MEKLTASNIVAFINQLDKRATYNYLNPKNKGLIEIVNIVSPEGPIWVNRWNPAKGETKKSKKPTTISTEMIWRVANAISIGQPFNIDRILGASFNTRSVLETLLAYTPQFHFCYPGELKALPGCLRLRRDINI